MKLVFLAVCIAMLSMTSIAADLPKPTIQELATTKEVADQLASWSAGFCKAMEEKQGMDFATCFKRVSDTAIARIEQEQAKKKH